MTESRNTGGVWSAPRPCRHPGCGRLVRDGSGYCPAHQSERNAGRFADKSRGSRQERGYGAEWEQLRKRILRRDKGLCQPCLKAGHPRPAQAVDHIVPKAEGGTDADDNLQAICTECHRAKTAEEAQRGRGLR